MQKNNKLKKFKLKKGEKYKRKTLQNCKRAAQRQKFITETKSVIKKNLKSLNRFHSANKIDNDNRGRKKGKKNQNKLQKKSKYKVNKCFS